MSEQIKHLEEMQTLIAAKCPITVTTGPTGKLITASYEKEWKEGSTTPEATKKKDQNGNPIIKYVEKYKQCKLTQDQIKKLESYISQNLEK